MKSIPVGLKYELEEHVSEDKCADSLGSGSLQVYGTPAMAALMEKTAFLSIEEFLEEKETTVGGYLEIKHLKPSAPGKRITCTSMTGQVEGNQVDFELEVWEGDKLVGTAKHTRFVVDTFRFLEKLAGH